MRGTVTEPTATGSSTISIPISSATPLFCPVIRTPTGLAIWPVSAAALQERWCSYPLTWHRSQPNRHVRPLSPCLSQLGLISTSSYDPITGDGAIGVEFAGTAVSSTSTFGAGVSPANADKLSVRYVVKNTDLQWSEGSYRGFFTLTVDPHQAQATYWAMRNVSECCHYGRSPLP